jgi:hypothetical protein
MFFLPHNSLPGILLFLGFLKNFHMCYFI